MPSMKAMNRFWIAFWRMLIGNIIVVGLVTTSPDNWIVGVQAFHDNPYDGRTLPACLAETKNTPAGSLLKPMSIAAIAGMR